MMLSDLNILVASAPFDPARTCALRVSVYPALCVFLAGGKAAPAGFTVKAPARPSAAAANGQDDESADAGDDSSGWETASESDGDADGQGGGEGSEEWSEWDPCVSFFDNKVSSSMEENLKYMYKKFGFFLPDAEYLADPEGLIKYLGAKLAHGKVGGDPSVGDSVYRGAHAGNGGYGEEVL